MSTYTTENFQLTLEEEASLIAYQLGIKSLAELRERGPVTEKDFWIIPGLVSRTKTFVYGQAKAGKSYLVSQVIHSLVTGEPVLGCEPLERGLKVMVIATDSAGQLEYRDRLDRLGTPGESVFILQTSGQTNEQTWAELAHFASVHGVGVVVVDHASSLIEGSMNDREGWQQLWETYLDKFGPSVAKVLVGHSTDSKFEGKQIHRPTGSYAASAFARAKVYLCAPGGVGADAREIRLESNNFESTTLVCRRGENGFLTLDSEATETKREQSPRNRQARTREMRDRIAEVAQQAPAGSQQDAVAWIAAQPGIEKEDGSVYTVRSLRARLSENKTITWDRELGKYRKVHSE